MDGFANNIQLLANTAGTCPLCLAQALHWQDMFCTCGACDAEFEFDAPSRTIWYSKLPDSFAHLSDPLSTRWNSREDVFLLAHPHLQAEVPAPPEIQITQPSMTRSPPHTAPAAGSAEPRRTGFGRIAGGVIGLGLLALLSNQLGTQFMGLPPPTGTPAPTLTPRLATTVASPLQSGLRPRPSATIPPPPPVFSAAQPKATLSPELSAASSQVNPDRNLQPLVSPLAPQLVQTVNALATETTQMRGGAVPPPPVPPASAGPGLILINSPTPIKVIPPATFTAIPPTKEPTVPAIKVEATETPKPEATKIPVNVPPTPEATKVATKPPNTPPSTADTIATAVSATAVSATAVSATAVSATAVSATAVSATAVSATAVSATASPATITATQKPNITATPVVTSSVSLTSSESISRSLVILRVKFKSDDGRPNTDLFIEIKNLGSQVENLDNWFLDSEFEGVGGSYDFPAAYEMKPGDTCRIYLGGASENRGTDTCRPLDMRLLEPMIIWSNKTKLELHNQNDDKDQIMFTCTYDLSNTPTAREYVCPIN